MLYVDKANRIFKENHNDIKEMYKVYGFQNGSRTLLSDLKL
jgi:hypothetical protein